MKLISYGVTAILCLTMAACNSTDKKNQTLDHQIEKKIDKLLAQMTLEEKIGQMNQLTSRWEMTGPAPKGTDEQRQLESIKKGWVGSLLNVVGTTATRKAQELAVKNSRLGIPMLFGYDVVHGYRTMFPIPLGMAASWNSEAVKKACEVEAREASAAGIHWTFAPMVDVARDARWGRIMEGFGEDPFLSGTMAYTSVKGFQGERLDSGDVIAACAKHYAAYGFAEAGRDYNTVEMSESTLRNGVLPPFRACADAGVATFMNSFNEINGVPSTGNEHLLRDILKGEWAFNGFVVSDWGSIAEMVSHGFAKDSMDAARLALTAGSDMDMEGHCYATSLKKLVEEGVIKEKQIDDAVRRILRIKYRMGLFDDPYRYCDSTREAKELLSQPNLEVAREVARESIVLLKNEGGLLPIPKSGKSIAVIGSLANDKDVPLGSWRGNAVANSAVSLLEGIQQAVGTQDKIYYAKGYTLTLGERAFSHPLTFDNNNRSGFAEAITIARKADLVIMAVGEDCYQTGEGRSQTDIGLRGLQEELLKEISKVNRNVVVVLMNGRPLVINWIAENVPAILETWFLGSQAGNAIADVLFGDYNPSGKLPVSFPRAVGQCPIYYNHKNTGRPAGTGNQVFWSHYTDQPNEPLYPFGYGLSYTSFEYSNLTLDKKEMTENDSLRVSVNVTNTGNMTGEEVAQLYIRDLVASITRPVKELKGYTKISLDPGQTKILTFTLTVNQLKFFGNDQHWKAEPGEFIVFVGGSSVDVKMEKFELK